MTHWLLKIIAAVVFGLMINAIEYFLYRYYLPRVEKRHQLWRQVFLRAIHQPLIYFIWLMVLSIIIETLIPAQNPNLALLDPARDIIVLLFLFWFFMRFIRRGEDVFVIRIENGKRQIFQDSTSVHALAQVFRIIAIVVVALMLMHSVGISISALLAFGGLGGLAISFAAKDTLANFIGGLIIYWDRPFSVGDLIGSPDRNIEGTVVKIGWRLTMVRTPDMRPLYIPNGIFSAIALENKSRLWHRRLEMIIGIRYEDADKLKRILKALADMLAKHSDIDQTQTTYVRLVELGVSALNIKIQAFTKVTEFVKFCEVQEDVLLKIMAIVTHYEAEFAYPTHTIHIPNGVEYFQSDAENGESNDDRNLQ
ncbi:MAG: hypothetical protein A3F10_00460 [Coxiella sp. RIFCSPHIGHO2_12_FULL_42_15]|nr:MAG: hypothetical protein A3F10_00460 [Coxiella sp. RIFCSPHIGHO2_12_FULL_42_15]